MRGLLFPLDDIHVFRNLDTIKHMASACYIICVLKLFRVNQDGEATVLIALWGHGTPFSVLTLPPHTSMCSCALEPAHACTHMHTHMHMCIHSCTHLHAMGLATPRQVCWFQVRGEASGAPGKPSPDVPQSSHLGRELAGSVRG